MTMDGRAKEVDRLVKGYDKCLFAKRESTGAIHIYRKLSHTRSAATPYHMVFALTDNWNATGKPREWGLEVIAARLRAVDLWKDHTIVDRIEKDLKDTDESNERTLKNNIESFLKDFRRQFARATNDVNTSSLSKADPRARFGA